MNRYVHEDLTRLWAEEAGFSAEDAATIARWDWNVDVGWPGHPLRNKRYHHLLWGGPRLAREYFAYALRERSLPHLGVALHIRQDVIGHGLVGSLVHWKAMDRWESRSERVHERLERASKSMLAAYLEVLDVSGDADGLLDDEADASNALPLPPV